MQSAAPQPSTHPISSIDSQLETSFKSFKIVQGEGEASIENRLILLYFQLLKSRIIEHTGNSNVVMPIEFPPSVQDAFKSQGIGYRMYGIAGTVAIKIFMSLRPHCEIACPPNVLTIPANKIALLQKQFAEEAKAAADNSSSTAQISLPYSQTDLLTKARQGYAPAKQPELPPSASSKQEAIARERKLS